MAVRLDIEVKHSGSGAGAGGFSAADAQGIQRALDQSNRLLVTMGRGAGDFGKGLRAAVDGLGKGLEAQTAAADRTAARLGLAFQRSLEQAGKQGGEKLGVEAGKAAERGFRANFRPLGAGLTAGGVTAVQAFGRYGQEAASAFGVAFSGGILNGNLLRGAAGLGAATLRLGGEIGRGLTQAVVGAFQLVPAVGGALAGVSKVIGAAFSVAGSLGGVLVNAAGEIAGAFGDALGTALKVTVGAAAVAGFASLRLALKAEALEPAFEKVAKATGDSVPSALAKLRTATQGTISDLDLMRSANEAVALRAAENVDQFGKLADVAIRLGRNVGRGPKDAINDLVVGLGRASPRILDNIGLQVQLEDAYGKGAAALGKNADALTDTEKRTALLNAVLDQAREKLSGQADTAGVVAVSLARAGASAENLGTSIGRIMLPAVEKLAGPLADVVDSLTRFVAREAGAGEGLAKGLSGAEAVAKNLVDFLDRANFEDFRKLAIDAFDTFSIYAKAAFGGAWDYFSLRAQQGFEELHALALELAPEIGTLFGSFFGRAAGKDLRDGNIGEGLQGPRARSAALGQRAQGVSFAPTGADAARLSSLSSGRASGIADVLSRPAAGAASRPSSRPTVASNDQIAPSRPLQSDALPDSGPFIQPQRSPLSALSAAAGPEVSGALGPILSQIAASITAAADPAKELAAAVGVFRAADIRGEVDRLGSALTEGLERSVDNFEDNIRDVERQEDAIGRKLADAYAAGAKLGEELRAGMDAISDAFARDRSAILNRRDQQISAAGARTTQRAGELLGDAGGIGPDASAIPPKLRRAAAKARKQANRERRESLRSLSDGQSVDDLAANGAAGLQAVFQEQAAKETGQAGAIEQAYSEAAAALRDLSNDRLAAEQELKAAIEADAEEQRALIEKSIEILRGLAESKERDKATLEKMKADLEEVQRKLQAVDNLAARAAR